MVSIAAMADVWISPGQGRTYTLLQLSQIAASGVKRPLPKLAPQAFTLNDTIVISVNDTLEIENKDNFQLKDVSGSIFVDGAVKMSPKDSATIRCITTFSGESSKPGQMVFRKGASNAIIRNMRLKGFLFGGIQIVVSIYEIPYSPRYGIEMLCSSSLVLQLSI